MTDWYHRIVNKLDTPNRTWFVISSILVILLAVCVSIIVTYAKSDAASRQSLAGCRMYKTIAEAPIPPETKDLGVQFVAAARVAYLTAHCNLGSLKPVQDPRLLPYLK